MLNKALIKAYFSKLDRVQKLAYDSLLLKYSRASVGKYHKQYVNKIEQKKNEEKKAVQSQSCFLEM